MARKSFPITEKSPTPLGIWKIERYGSHEDGKWTEVSTDDHPMFFIFKNMCLSLQHGQVLVDHISLLTENVHILTKHGSLGIIVIKERVKTKKLRLKFAGTGLNPSTVMVNQCLRKLKPFVRIEDISPQPRDFKGKQEIRERESVIFTQETQKSKGFCDAESSFISLSKQVSNFLNKHIPDFYADNKDLYSIYPVEDIIESCILDSDFPSFVAQVHHILTDKLKK